MSTQPTNPLAAPPPIPQPTPQIQPSPHLLQLAMGSTGALTQSTSCYYRPDEITRDLEVLTRAQTQLRLLATTTATSTLSGGSRRDYSHASLAAFLSHVIRLLRYLQDVDEALFRSTPMTLPTAIFLSSFQRGVSLFASAWSRISDSGLVLHLMVESYAVEKLTPPLAVCRRWEGRSMSARDQKATFVLLSRVLPPELAVVCMDLAEYWTLENTTVKMDDVQIPNERSGERWLQYLTTSEWIGKAERICEVRVTVVSCDSLWATLNLQKAQSVVEPCEHQTVGSYMGEKRETVFSETVFQVAFVGRDGPNERTKWIELSRVKERIGYMDIKELVWRKGRLGERDGMVCLRVTSNDWGRNLGWTNNIQAAKIEVFTSAV